MITREARTYLTIAAAISILFFILFKHFYPYPNMVMDSYVYLKAAVLHWGANSYPIGYSKFLELFLFYSHSSVLLVWLQYLLLELSCALLFLTVAYFFKPAKLVQCILLAFLFCNPLFMFSSNFIMSDVLYTTFSILWLTQLIWIIGRPRPFMIWSNAILLLLAYATRYNSIYYPLLSSIFILLSSFKLRTKITAILLEIAFVGLFIQYTRIEMKGLTGIRQFSPAGGWHIANNALYMYSHIYLENKDPVPQKFQQLDSIVRTYFDHTKHTVGVLEFSRINGFGGYYLDDKTSPLFRYMYWKYGYDTDLISYKKWGPMGELCAEYGTHLVRHHPLDFLRYYALPNTVRYIFPPTEVFALYTPFFLRHDDFGDIAAHSLHLKTLTVSMNLINFRTSILSYYPIIFGLLNIFMVLAAIGFLFFRGYKKINKNILYILLCVTSLYFLNFLFSVTAASIVLRYELFVLIILFVFDVLLGAIIYNLNAGHWGD